MDDASADRVEDAGEGEAVPGERSAAPRHPIGVVAERTGLSPHTIRAWEKRYGVVTPARSEGGHRLYSDDQVHRLRLLHAVTEGGRQIGQVAELETDALEALLTEDRSERRVAEVLLGGEPARREPSPEMRRRLADVRERALRSVEEFDGPALERILHGAAVEMGAARWIEDLAAPLLREIGERWHRDELRPAQEHLASAMVRRVVHWVMESARTPHEAPVLLVATPAGERHEVGALLAAATAVTSGWRVAYLGSDLPAKEILVAARATGARAVALSFVYPEVAEAVRPEIVALGRRLPAGTPLWLGGSGVEALGDAVERSGARTLPDMAALRRLLGEELSLPRGSTS